MLTKQLDLRTFTASFDKLNRGPNLFGKPRKTSTSPQNNFDEFGLHTELLSWGFYAIENPWSS